MPTQHTVFPKKALALSITLISVFSLTACSGSGVSFNSNSAQVKTDENTAGIFWQANAQVQGDSKTLTYKISGADASLFKINPTSGELAFKVPADFESPTDTNKNNEYLFDIEASINATNSATQHVQVLVKDISKPTVTLIKPKLNENVGDGNSLEVEAWVKFYDAESNTPINGSSATLNTSPLAKDATDPQLWKGKITVPEGEIDIAMTGFLADSTPVKSTAKLFNKPNSISPNYLGINPGAYVVFFDFPRGRIGKIDLKSKIWDTYFEDSAIRRPSVHYDLNAHSQIIYLVEPISEQLFAFGIADALPTVYRAGCISGTSSLTYDATHHRLIALTKTTVLGTDKYQAVTIATDDSQGFVNIQKSNILPVEKPCLAAATQPVWDVPADAITGSFKYFNFHQTSKTYIIADERSINNIKQTLVQGFGEDGRKKFETLIGPDISNFAVDEAAGLVYVAEQHSSAAGTIKTININNGETHDLVKSYGTSNIGAYTNIQMDSINKRLYVGDDVSDSIFVVDLSTYTLSELLYNRAPIIIWD